MRDRRAARSTSMSKLAAAYSLTILGTFALFFLIRGFGEGLVAPAAGPATATAPAKAAKVEVLMHVLLAILTITAACRLVGAIFRHFRQPPVIGEIVAGILLGPSLLGRVSPGLAAYLLPTEVAPFLGLVAQLGVILYMFMVGLELDTGTLLHRGHTAVAISHASIVVPFLLGAGLALGLYPRLSSGEVSFTSFALFLGVAMSVTAFPVLARILTDRGMSTSPLGVMALTCAAVDDVTAWCLLAVVVGVVQAKVGGAFVVIVGAAGFIAFMLVVARPLLLRLSRFDQQEELSSATTSLVFVALLSSACATEFLGIHAVFGAFLLGLVIPHDSAVSRQLVRKMQDVVSVLLLPAFFAYTGMRTRIELVSGPEEWLLCGLIIAVATVGKFGGSLAAARLTGTGWWDAAALGTLMNTRGLMELIVLNIGLDLGVITPKLFAMMVLMALATTMATTPALHLLESLAAARRPREEAVGAATLVVR